MKKLIEKLNNAAEAYYNGNEIMSNYEYDTLYDQLLQMEKEPQEDWKGAVHKIGMDY